MRTFSALLVSLLSLPALAADQTVPGAGNAQAAAIAAGSPRVQRAMRFLVEQAEQIDGSKLRRETLDIRVKAELQALRQTNVL